ncbi:hypothetical protein K470DRAFT_293164 [Piedraia hortae CBS 480.64]|uniref:DUF7924 domain-containing protein n=1 Tax=Piedraia hortae CBS 480.64 TaxID=1314780 RepID=A0A6A7C6X2_9PEZI|nr:hypothetical protein K470DRAFT_293164 [Piedraia hortae CBS 480.64]
MEGSDQIAAIVGTKRKRDGDALSESDRSPKRFATSLSIRSFDISGPDDPVAHWVLASNWPSSMGEPSNPRKRTAESITTVPINEYKKVIVQLPTNVQNLMKRENLEKYSKYGNGLYLPVPDTGLDSAEAWDERNEKFGRLNESYLVQKLTKLFLPHPADILTDEGPGMTNIEDYPDVDWEWRLPDITLDLKPKVFTVTELRRLENYNHLRPAMFAEGLSFPFFVCEVKALNGKWDEGLRQELGAAATYVDAIVQLCEAVKPDEVNQLQGQILGFGTLHNHEKIEIYGHFNLKDDNKEEINYYCHAFFDIKVSENFEVNPDYGVPGGRHPDRRMSSKSAAIIQELYTDFCVLHKKRILDYVNILSDATDLQVGITQEHLEATSSKRQRTAANATSTAQANNKVIATKDEVIEKLEQQVQQVRVDKDAEIERNNQANAKVIASKVAEIEELRQQLQKKNQTLERVQQQADNQHQLLSQQLLFFQCQVESLQEEVRELRKIPYGSGWIQYQMNK